MRIDKKPMLEELKKLLSAKCYNYFTLNINVINEHIDHYHHVNNLIYLKWFLDGAQAHSEALGFGANEYKKIGAAFFVRKHEITYHQPAYLGDELILATWCGKIKAGSATRYYELYRYGNKKIMQNLEKLTSGSTLWAYVNLETKTPQMIPQEIKSAFSNQSIEL